MYGGIPRRTLAVAQRFHRAGIFDWIFGKSRKPENTKLETTTNELKTSSEINKPIQAPEKIKLESERYNFGPLRRT